MSYVVPVAHVGEAYFPQIAESLQQSEVIRQRLARMLKIAECIDHGHASVLGHSLHGAVSVGA